MVKKKNVKKKKKKKKGINIHQLTSSKVGGEKILPYQLRYGPPHNETKAGLAVDLLTLTRLNKNKLRGAFTFILLSKAACSCPSSEVVRMAGNVKRFYDLTAKLLSGEMFSFSALKGKVVLIENVASLWGTTIRDYTQMNELHSRYSDKGLVILGVPCNQFGHQVRLVWFETWASLFSRWRVLFTQPESYLLHGMFKFNSSNLAM